MGNDKNYDKKFTVSLNIENIGPYFGENILSHSEQVNSNKIIIYAANGTGKSFISRSFHICSNSNNDTNTDRYLTIGENRGCFSFSISDDTGTKTLKAEINKGQPPKTENKTGLFFHVFNSDYVDENVKANNFTPDGSIDGYIVGKSQIDLSDEKSAIDIIEKNKYKTLSDIQFAIDKGKEFLKKQGVSLNTTEFRQISLENLRKGFDYKVDSVDNNLEKLNNLSGAPEEIPDIPFTISYADLRFFETLETILATVYPKSDWDIEFVRDYKNHQSFIEEGLQFDHSDRKCPFCKQEYSTEALELINKYNLYKNDQESKVISQLNDAAKALSDLLDKIKKVEKTNDKTDLELLKLQKYFPSMSSLKIDHLSQLELYTSTISELQKVIEEKKDKLYSIQNAEETINLCREIWHVVEGNQSRNKQTVEKANRIKNDLNAERLRLRKQLCQAYSVKLQKDLDGELDELNKQENELASHIEELQRKEQKISKKEKVYETLDYLLNRFFNGKYEIDKETFRIRFLGNLLNNTSYVLSDGEKSIVAFCWYLAETHNIVNEESDYNKLFFIIDDPISSMDFHYVYAVAQTIRDIKCIFGFSSHERVWILTHNLEFLNIFIRNRILTNALILKPGYMGPFNNKLLLPYESHLHDLIEIAYNGTPPNHTTPNSIRHVIETICKFEEPEYGIENFIKKYDSLSKDSCVYTICQDLSHGDLREQPPFSEDILTTAVKTVVDFVEANYPGHIQLVKKHKDT